MRSSFLVSVLALSSVLAFGQVEAQRGRFISVPGFTPGLGTSSYDWSFQPGVAFAADGAIWTVLGMPTNDPNGVVDAGEVHVVRIDRDASQIFHLRSPTPATQEGFGSVVACDGTTLLVRSYLSGTVRFYRRFGNSWTLEHTWMGSPTYHPGAISVRADLAFIGDLTGAGRVHVLRRSSSGWATELQLTASQPRVDWGFGGGISSSSRWLAVSEYVGPVQSCIGRAFVFDLANLAAPPVQLPAPSGLSGCPLFGTGIAASDDSIAVCARDDSANGWASGSVVFYELQGSTWTQSLRMGPFTSDSDREWGVGAFGSGCAVVAGGHNDGGRRYQPAMVFQKSGSTRFLSHLLVTPPGSTWWFNGRAALNRTFVMPVVQGEQYGVALYALDDCDSNGVDSELESTLGWSSSPRALPESLSLLPGQQAQFTVAATANAFQWRRNGVSIANSSRVSGATTSTLAISQVSGTDAGLYDCVVTSPCGTITSAPATLSCKAAITTQPEGGSFIGGQQVTLSVVAANASGASYRWRKNGVNLFNGINYQGVSTPTLIINADEPSQSGTYSVAITNACGVTISNDADVEVTCPADFNVDGGVDGQDVFEFFDAWINGFSNADINLDGGTDGSDVNAFYERWENGC